MDPVTLMAIGAALGVAKREFEDKPREDRQRLYEANAARYSPWTGIKPERVNEGSLAGNAVQGGLTGLAIGQQLPPGADKTKNMGTMAGAQDYYGPPREQWGPPSDLKPQPTGSGYMPGNAWGETYGDYLAKQAEGGYGYRSPWSMVR